MLRPSKSGGKNYLTLRSVSMEAKKNMKAKDKATVTGTKSRFITEKTMIQPEPIVETPMKITQATGAKVSRPP